MTTDLHGHSLPAIRAKPPPASSIIVSRSKQGGNGAHGPRGQMTCFASHALAVPGRVDVAAWHGKNAPARRWVVDGLLPEGNVTLLSGDGGIGKSLLALQLLAAAALGKAWLGRNTRPCKAVGFFCEDDGDELWRRLEDVARYYGASVDDLAENLQLFSRAGQDNLLLVWPRPFEPGEPTPLLGQLSNVAVDWGAEIVVLDSLHDLFGGNENSRPQARQFIGELRGLAMHVAGAVLLTMHPSIAGRNTGTGEAGSTAWNNAVRSRLYLTAPLRDEDERRNGPGEYRELATMKANYSAAGSRIRLRWDQGVFALVDQAAGDMVSAIERRSTESTFLECLRALERQGRWVSQARSSPDYAPKVIVKMPQARAHTKADIEAAMQALFAANRIKVGEVGKLANRLPRMGIVRVQETEADDGS